MKILLPTDVIVADKFDAEANTQTVSVDAIPDGWMGLDIGPDSIKSFQKELMTCKALLHLSPIISPCLPSIPRCSRRAPSSRTTAHRHRRALRGCEAACNPARRASAASPSQPRLA